MRLLDHYGSLCEMFEAGPWDWIKRPSIGLKTVNLTAHIINHYVSKKVIPTFSSLEMIVQMGAYVNYLELAAMLAMLECLIEPSEED